MRRPSPRTAPPIDGRRPIVGVLTIFLGLVAIGIGVLTFGAGVAEGNPKLAGGSGFLVLTGVLALAIGISLCRGSRRARRHPRRVSGRRPPRASAGRSPSRPAPR